MSESVKVFKDVSLTFFSTIVSMLLSFLLTIILGRYMGAGDLGVYRIILSVYWISMLVLALGIPAAVIKYIAESKDDRDKVDSLASSAILSSLMLGIICSLLIFTASGWLAGIFHEPSLARLFIILSPVYPFALVGGVLSAFTNGMRSMWTYAKAAILQSGVLFLVSILLIHEGYGVAGTVIGICVSSMINCLYLLYVTKNNYKLTFSKLGHTTRGLLSFGARILMANGINQINYQADIIFIGLFLSATDVAFYSVAVLLSTSVWIIPQCIETITYPAITEYQVKKDHAAIQIMVDKSLKYSSCMLAPLCLFIIFFSVPIVQTIYGAPFLKSIMPLQILILGTLIIGSIQKPVGSILFALGKPNLNLKIYTFAAAGNIVLNILLIPFFGVSGASVATVFSYLFITVFVIYYMIKMTDVRLDFKWFFRMGMLISSALILYHIGGFNKNITGAVLLIVVVIVIWVYFLSSGDKDYLITQFKTGLDIYKPDIS